MEPATASRSPPLPREGTQRPPSRQGQDGTSCACAASSPSPPPSPPSWAWFCSSAGCWAGSALPRPPSSPRPSPAAALVLVLEGPAVAADTWLDPDGPAGNWADADLVHLQGPLTPDRLLFRFDLSGLPAGATVVSATLTLQVELWGDQSLPGAAVAYRLLTPWQPATATYDTPWTAPGLAAGWDYDSVPLGMAPVPDLGALVLDVTPAVAAWLGGQPNNGLVVMMSADSHNQSHHWVIMTEQPSPADRPTLRIAYEEASPMTALWSGSPLARRRAAAGEGEIP